MGNRNRVRSFISSFSSSGKENRNILNSITTSQSKYDSPSVPEEYQDCSGPPRQTSLNDQKKEPTQLPQHERVPSGSRPLSTFQIYQPPLMDVNQDTLPELQPVFTFLNNHANKLYQEGYFLKLDDQNTQGRQNTDRSWTECFAQLVGTVLSLWDASELDEAGQDGEVLPKFINLTDASIKMIESLPTRSQNDVCLQNVLSISTAGKNRYLLHFNSHHSLIQWTSGIRLSMYEHATLQEAYTGALIAGKGKTLNNINAIMERSRYPSADWVRVRFGAGTPWRRCWCVISPPDEKEVLKQQKQRKKKSIYDLSKPPTLRGDIKFFNSKRTKKVQPIATITDAYSAFAIYPQSKPLIDASTLVKVEGSITIHSNPSSTTEGFVFVMPEVHPAVTGFEMMLRWLFPVFDTFGLYGRPGRLVAATEDVRSLMFAMPTQRKYGYLEILDVSQLISEPESSSWKESQWRTNMKELTAKRMMAGNGNKIDSQGTVRNSLGPRRARGIQFHDDDNTSVKSTPSTAWAPNAPDIAENRRSRARTDSAPPTAGVCAVPQNQTHNRSVSETHANSSIQNQAAPARKVVEKSKHISPNYGIRHVIDTIDTSDTVSSDDEVIPQTNTIPGLNGLQSESSLEPVATPPAFVHAPGAMPLSKPYHSSKLRRANSRMSTNTLNQLVDASNVLPDLERNESPDSQHRKSQDLDESPKICYTRSPNNSKEQLSTPSDPSNEAKSTRKNKPGFQNNKNRRNAKNNHECLPSDPQAIIHDQNSFDFDPSTLPYPPPTKQLPLIPSKEFTAAQDKKRSNPALSDSSSGNCLSKSTDVDQKPLPNIPLVIKNETPSKSVLEQKNKSPDGKFFDQDIFDNIQYGPLPESYSTNNVLNRSENASATKSSDCSSTEAPFGFLRSIDKPRAGKMRTVGDPDAVNNDILLEPLSLEIDFGPTLNYSRCKASDAPLTSKAKSTSFNLKEQTDEYGPQKLSSNSGPDSCVRSKTPEKAEISRTLAWNPMLANHGNSGMQQKGITAEDFVAQRASFAPLYTHQRVLSLDPNRNPAVSSTSKNVISDRPNQAIHSNNTSIDYISMGDQLQIGSTESLSRPNSKGTTQALGNYKHSRNASSGLLSLRNGSIDILPRPGSAGASQVLGTNNHSRNVSSELLTLRNGSTDFLSRPSSRGASQVLGNHNNSMNASSDLFSLRNGSTDILPRPGSAGASQVLGTNNHSRNVSSELLTLRNGSTDFLSRPSSRGASQVLSTGSHMRNLSKDMVQRKNHSSGNSLDPLQRPNSRSASAALGSNGDMGSHLTAREQAHLSRVTGQPLINMATGGKQKPSAGLVAALEARERDKEVAKQGLNSQAVEQAIHQRQQAFHQQQSYQIGMDFRLQGQNGNITSTSLQKLTHGPSHMQYPVSNIFTPGAGASWTPHMPNYSIAVEPGRYSPSPYHQSRP